LKDQINELETNCKDKNVKRTVQMHKWIWEGLPT
jgi:hypothetical protein